MLNISLAGLQSCVYRATHGAPTTDTTAMVWQETRDCLFSKPCDAESALFKYIKMSKAKWNTGIYVKKYLDIPQKHSLRLLRQTSMRDFPSEHGNHKL